MTVAHKAGRLFPSLALFSSFFLLGVFVSALGPTVSSLSRDIGVREVSFGMAFALRGLGHLLGSCSSSVKLPAMGQSARVQRALGDRMNRLGAATAGIGLFSLALDTAGTLWLVCIWCFLQGFCGGIIDAVANAAISAVHGVRVAPWMQGLHFCFSAGALVAPVAVGQFGYRAVFSTFGLLSMPSALACCLASTSGNLCGWSGGGRYHLHTESEERIDEHMHLSLQSCGNDKALRDIIQAQQQQQLELQQQFNGEVPPPQGEDEGEEAKPPFPLVGLLALFSCLYVGAEVGFGAWVAVVVLREDLAGEVGAAFMASLFWGGITVGRLVAVPLAVRFSTGSLVQANLIGGVSSSVFLLVVGRDSIAWAAIGAALFGLFMASTFPLAMSLLPSVAYVLSDKNSSRVVNGGALGEMMVPALIAALLGSRDGGWPTALYAVCSAISVLLAIVYVTWCSVLTAIGRRTDQG